MTYSTLFQKKLGALCICSVYQKEAKRTKNGRKLAIANMYLDCQHNNNFLKNNPSF